MISKNNLKRGLVRPQHTFPLCVSPSQMSLGPEKLATFLDVVDTGLLLCIVQFYLALMDVTFQKKMQENEKKQMCKQHTTVMYCGHVKFQVGFLEDSVRELSNIFGISVNKNPLVLLLGKLPENIRKNDVCLFLIRVTLIKQMTRNWLKDDNLEIPNGRIL